MQIYPTDADKLSIKKKLKKAICCNDFHSFQVLLTKILCGLFFHRLIPNKINDLFAILNKLSDFLLHIDIHVCDHSSVAEVLRYNIYAMYFKYHKFMTHAHKN